MDSHMLQKLSGRSLLLRLPCFINGMDPAGSGSATLVFVDLVTSLFFWLNDYNFINNFFGKWICLIFAYTLPIRQQDQIGETSLAELGLYAKSTQNRAWRYTLMCFGSGTGRYSFYIK
jgi:hypothetical protein